MTYQNNFDVVLINDVLPIALIEAEEIALNFLSQKTATKVVAEKTIAIKKKKEKKKKKKEGKSPKNKSAKKNKKIPTDIIW